jgi:CheY-like chemotaxis protein
MKALLVEDDPALLITMAEALDEIGVHHLPATSAEAALAILLTGIHDVEIVFSDIRLAGIMDGIDFAREVRLRWPTLPFVITSGNPGRRLVHQPRDVLFLPKPWGIEQFIEVTRAALLQFPKSSS